MQPKFMTGVHGAFVAEKLTRETRSGFHGIEVSCLRDWDEVRQVTTFARDNGLAVGVHFPLIRDHYPCVSLHPWLISTNEDVRNAGFQAVARDLEAACSLGAEYLIVHYPKPALLDERFDWSDWRIVSGGEAVDRRTTTRSQQEDLSYAAFDRLSLLARQTSAKLVVEHDILNAWHYESLDQRALLPRLFSTYPGLGFCADAGRLHLQEATDPAFDAERFLSLMLPHITNVHVWNVQVGTNRFGGHHPARPCLNGRDGWGDIAGMLQVLASLQESHVMFEHRADEVSDQELDECYAWVASLLSQ